MLQQCIDSLVQKIQHGVVINFEKFGPDPTPLLPESNKDAEIMDCDKGKDLDSYPVDGQLKTGPSVSNSIVVLLRTFLLFENT